MWDDIDWDAPTKPASKAFDDVKWTVVEEE
jgi:hypothetical protein